MKVLSGEKEHASFSMVREIVPDLTFWEVVQHLNVKEIDFDKRTST